MPVAIVTGASRGLGFALARSLSEQGWDLVIDGRDADALDSAAQRLDSPRAVRAIAGDVADASHRSALIAAAIDLGGIDLLVNNASDLGPSPLPRIAEYPLDAIRHVYEVNAVAPLALSQLALPHLRERFGTIVNITSDAAVEPYEGWGGYGSSKAALEQIGNVLGPTGALLKGAPGAIDDGMWARNYVWQRYTTIGAGPTEVQKNIIADRALRLER